MARALPEVKNYVKNIGKSFGYSFKDYLKNTAPDTFDLIEMNSATVKEAYDKIKSGRDRMKAAKNNTLFKDVFDTGKKNILDDLKTGKLYNKDRDSGIGFGLDDEFGDFDSWESDWSDDDWSGDWNESNDTFNSDEPNYSSKPSARSDSETKRYARATMRSSKALASAYGKVAKVSIDANAKIGITTSRHIAGSIQKSTSILYAQNEKLQATIKGGFVDTIKEISKISSLAPGMQAHMENSRTYYEESLKLQASTNAMMKEFVEMQRNLYERKREEEKESQYSKTFKNGFDLESYGKAIFGNISNYLPIGGGGGLNLKSFLMSFTDNPLKLIPDMILKVVVPKTIESTIKKFDSLIEGTLSTGMSRLLSKGGILADILGVGINNKDYINPSKYDKGPRPFDGVTRKAIIEVIPAYLARIEGILSNSEDRIFNFENGTWTTASSLRRNINRKKKEAVEDGIGNLDIELEKYIYELKSQNEESREHAEKLEKSIEKMFTKIYDDYGKFDANKTGAWRYYGFDDFNSYFEVLKRLKPNRADMYKLSKRMIGAREDLSEWYHAMENGDGPYVNLFNGNYSSLNRSELDELYEPDAFRKYHFKSKSAFYKAIKEKYGIDLRKPRPKNSGEDKFSITNRANNILQSATDEYNNNVFTYLRGIYAELQVIRENGGIGSSKSYGIGFRKSVNPISDFEEGLKEKIKIEEERAKRSNNNPVVNSDSNDDSDFSPYDIYFSNEEIKDAQENKITKKGKSFIKDSLIGRTYSGAKEKITNNKILGAPVRLISKAYEKIDRHVYKLLFGDPKKKINDDEIEADGVIDYIVEKVKSTFNEFREWFKKTIWEKFKNSAFYQKIVNPLINKVKEKARPVGEELKKKLKGGFDITKRAIGENTPLGWYIKDAYEHQDYDFDNPYMDYGDITNMAKGGIVKRRGLHMLSPGEMIIPSSFDKRVQARQLREEKAMKRRLFPNLPVEFNAEGTADEPKDYLQMLWNGIVHAAKQGSDKAEETSKKIKQNAELTQDKLDRTEVVKTTKKVMHQISPHSSSIIADSLLGGGVSLLTGMIGGPLLGAAAGAGYGIIKHSKTMQNIVFGKDTLTMEDGTEVKSGGLIPPKIQAFFKKNFKSMRDTGIVGGILGLLGPFGIIPGIAMGAGIGYLKNNEKVKTFLFGKQGENGEWEEGLIKKELQQKIGKGIPRMAAGAIIANIIGGPFGIMGNAILGSVAGFATTTETFQRIVFGRKDENGKRVGGLVGKINVLIEKTINFGKKHILAPLKDFAKPFAQMVKNGIENVTDGVKNFLNDMFERTIGIPLHDFIQHKVVGGILKWMKRLLFLPVTAAKGAIAAPFHALGWVGNNIRNSQIKKGTARDMTAQQRLEWREKHKIRNNLGLKWDRFNGVDEMLANDFNGEDGLEKISEMKSAIDAMLEGGKGFNADAARLVTEIGRDVSKYLNETAYSGDARYSLYDKVGYKRVKELSKAIRSGKWEKVTAIVAKKFSKFLTMDQQIHFLNKVIGEARVRRITDLREGKTEANKAQKDAYSKLASFKGGFLNRKGLKRLKGYLEIEEKAKERDKILADEEDNEVVKNNPVVGEFRNAFSAKSGYITDILKTTGERIEDIKKYFYDENTGKQSIRTLIKEVVDGKEENNEEKNSPKDKLKLAQKNLKEYGNVFGDKADSKTTPTVIGSSSSAISYKDAAKQYGLTTQDIFRLGLRFDPKEGKFKYKDGSYYKSLNDSTKDLKIQDVNNFDNVNDVVNESAGDNPTEAEKGRIRTKLSRLINARKNKKEKKRDGNPNSSENNTDAKETIGPGIVQGSRSKLLKDLNKGFSVDKNPDGTPVLINNKTGRPYGKFSARFLKFVKEQKEERLQGKTFREAISQSLFGRAIKKGAGFIGKAFKFTKDSIFGGISALANNTGIVGKILKGVFIGGTAMAAIGWGSELLPKLWERVKPIVSPIWEKIKGFFKGAWEKIKEYFGNLFPGLFGETGFITTTFKKLKNFVMHPLDSIKEFYVGGIKHFWENIAKPALTKGIPVLAKFLGNVIYKAIHGDENDISQDSFWSNTIGTAEKKTGEEHEYQLRDEKTGEKLYIDENGNYTTENTGKAAIASTTYDYQKYNSNLLAYKGSTWNGARISEKWTTENPINGDTYCKMAFRINNNKSRGSFESGAGIGSNYYAIENTKTHDYIRLENPTATIGIFANVVVGNRDSEGVTPVYRDQPNFFGLIGSFGLYDITLQALNDWPSFSTTAEYETAKSNNNYSVIESEATTLTSNKLSSNRYNTTVDGSFPLSGTLWVWEKYENTYQWVERDASEISESQASFLRKMYMEDGTEGWYDTQLAYRNLPAEIKELTTSKDWHPNKDPNNTINYITTTRFSGYSVKGATNTPTSSTTSMEGNAAQSAANVANNAGAVSSNLSDEQKSLITRFREGFSNTFKSRKNKDGSNISSIDQLAEAIQKEGGETKTFASLGAHGRSKSGLGHIYQKATDIIGKKFGSNTMGDAGCGPVTATNMLNKLSGTGSPLDTATEIASKYIDNTGGTTTDYFKDIFNRNGYQTAQTTNKKSIREALKAGVPTVLLGNSGRNTAADPFGDNDHYINAYGVDKNNNVIVEDPDLPESRVKYPLNRVMKDVKHGTLVGNSRFSGKGVDYKQANANYIYTWFKQLNVPDDHIAAVLSNWEAESGIDPTGVETIYSPKYIMSQEKLNAMANPNNFSLNVMFPKYARSGISLHKSAYKGDDGLYYPGVGLGGFTGPAVSGLLKKSQQIGKPWYELESQLRYMTDVEGPTYTRGKHSGRSWIDNVFIPAKFSSPSEGAAWFEKNWEGSTFHQAEHMRTAQSWYDKIKNGQMSTVDLNASITPTAEGVNTGGEQSQGTKQNGLASKIMALGGAILKKMYGSQIVDLLGGGTATSSSTTVEGGDSSTSTDINSGGTYNGTNDPNSSWTWPIHSKDHSYISSKFGPRNPSIGSNPHKGIDIAGGNGSLGGKEILAVAPGIVTKVVNGLTTARGRYVQIKHKTSDGRDMYVIYQHNKRNLVKQGDTVQQGQSIGIVGGTGTKETSYANHLHFEVSPDGIRNNAVDPLGFINQSRKYSGSAREMITVPKTSSKDYVKNNKISIKDKRENNKNMYKPLKLSTKILSEDKLSNKQTEKFRSLFRGNDGNIYGPPIKGAASRSGKTSTEIDYNKILATIVNILTVIAKNTATLNQIIEILSNSGIKIDRSSIQNAANSRDANENINDIVKSAMSRSGKASSYANYIPMSTASSDSDLQYIAQIMETIAKQ